jgi:hypothetical protein
MGGGGKESGLQISRVAQVLDDMFFCAEDHENMVSRVTTWTRKDSNGGLFDVT